MTKHRKKLFYAVLTVAAVCLCAPAMSNPNNGTNSNELTISLSGTWQFQADPHKQGEKQKWFTQNLEESVQLPGSMDENKKGTPVAERSVRHLNRLYQYTGLAWYQKKVTLPESWDKKQITLFIERAHWSTIVFVNGQRVPGIQESLSVPHRHDLTDYLTPGENTITVVIDNTVRFHLGGHSYSDETQTNWNGMTGRIELQASDPVWIAGVQVYPNVSNHTLNVITKVANKSRQPTTATLNFSVAGRTSQSSIMVAAGQTGEDTTALTLPKDTQLWDDLTPTLYTLDVNLSVDKEFSDSKSIRFGMRETSIVDNKIALNGIPTFLRGNVENCEFPLTGYPSSKNEDWRQMFTAFKDYGINHVRFHSYTPPEAAFVAADELGIILQTELPFWGLTGENPEMDAYLRRELDRILDEYGNHPSFVMMCMGNELNIRAGNFDINEEWVRHGQQKDPRHLYTASTSLFKKFRPTDQFLIGTRIRQIMSAGTDWDHEKRLVDFYDGNSPPAPIISHELGQWCVYPDFSEIEKYTGILRATNFEVFKGTLEKNHMGDQAADFTQASGRLAALLYRHEMEAVFRTRGAGGFQLLQLHDFPGQGTATVGILNVFRESKGVIEPDMWTRSCSDAMPLLRFPKRTWKTTESFSGTAEFIHYRKQMLSNVTANWEAVTEDGTVVTSGAFNPTDALNGELVELGKINIDLSDVKTAARLTILLTVNEDIVNNWSIWVYPEIDLTPGQVVVTNEWNVATKTALNNGQSVLLQLDLEPGPHTIPAQFLLPFWSPQFKPDNSSTMGLLCDPKHPVFKSFPTDFHTDWQWYDILVTKKHPKSEAWTWPGFDTYCLDIGNMPAETRPLIQPIDHFYRNKRLGLLVEGRYGKGKIMICAANLDKDADRRVATTSLKQSILNYMNTTEFNPTVEITDDMLKQWLTSAEDVPGLEVKYVSTQHVNMPAEKALDGDGYSYWMNDNKEGITYPHEIHFELPKPVLVKGFRYTPRQDHNRLGLIGKYEFYVTDHAFHWYTPVATGTFKDGFETQTIMLKEPKAGRNFRLIALEAIDAGERMATMAEFELITEELTEFEYVP